MDGEDLGRLDRREPASRSPGRGATPESRTTSASRSYPRRASPRVRSARVSSFSSRCRRGYCTERRSLLPTWRTRVAALRNPMETAEAARRFSADGVRFVRVNHADPHGRCRSKELPIDRLAMATGGVGYCAASLVEGLDGEPLMGEAFPCGGQGFPDLHAVGDLATARVAPWQPDTLWLLADLVEPDGTPSPLCMRGVLQRVIERLASHGLRAMVASEPEFYVLRVGAGGAIEHYSPLSGMAYTTGVRADPTGLVRRIHTALEHVRARRDDGTARVLDPASSRSTLCTPTRWQRQTTRSCSRRSSRRWPRGEGLLATFMAKPAHRLRGLQPSRARLAVARRGQRVRRRAGTRCRGARLRGRAHRSRGGV